MWTPRILFCLLLFTVTCAFPDCLHGPLTKSPVCDISIPPQTRARALINLFTDAELIANTVNDSPGVPRLGLPSYQWWSEALHGVAGSPGVNFTSSGNFSTATSFPQPILLGSAFDDALIKATAVVTSTEARAFNNAGRAGLDFFTPNINPFKDPRWGRGQETPGEDPLHVARYALNLVEGLQGTVPATGDDTTATPSRHYLRVAADCKHYAAYDLENWNGIDRSNFDARVTLQDLTEYYLPPFQACVRDAKVASVMCSFNSVNGVPSCTNRYLLQTILRDFWGFGGPDNGWVTADCDAVDNIFSTHHFTNDSVSAAAGALKAGTDLDCGTTYSKFLPEALNKSLITRADLERSLIRQYTSLIRLGYFDPPEIQPYRQITWSDVNLPSSQRLAYKAALEGIVLLKNDGLLPLSPPGVIKRLALIGPWANATTQMQGNYNGAAPFLVSPLLGAQNAGYEVRYVQGTTISGTSRDGFSESVTAAKEADVVIFAGGIDGTVENEALDRLDIAWPKTQLELVEALLEGTEGKKPLVVLQFGGGQLDGTMLKNSKSVNAILWAGYPGQSGGTAIFDILTGKMSPSGRLSTTQYPAIYTSQINMTNMNLRPSSHSPGRTYRWYQDTPVYEFGHGLSYTTFSLQWDDRHPPVRRYDISNLISAAATSGTPLDLVPFDTFHVRVTNTGAMTSDYVALLFVNSKAAAGPEPRPNKQLVSYTRVHGVRPVGGATAVASLPVTLGAIARADENGNMWVYEGVYELSVDIGGGPHGGELLKSRFFEVVGGSVQITRWPQPF